MQSKYFATALCACLFNLALLPNLYAQPQAFSDNIHHHTSLKRSSSSTRLLLGDIVPISETVHSSYMMTFELLFGDDARVSDFRAGLEKAILLKVDGLEEGIYYAGESIIFQVEFDYWLDEEIFYLTFDNNGSDESLRMSLPHDPGRGPGDITSGPWSGPGGPDDIAGSPYAPYCPAPIVPGKRDATGSTSEPDHVETLSATQVVNEARILDLQQQAADFDRITDQPIDSTTYPTGPNPWLTAEELERQDGLPRVAVNTTEGIVFLPYAIIEEDGVELLMVSEDWAVGTVDDLQIAVKRSVALDAVWFPDGNIPWKDINLDTPTRERVQNRLDYIEDRTPLNFFHSPNSQSPLGIKLSSTLKKGGMVYGYWWQNKKKRRLSLSTKNGTPSELTIVHEMFHALGFPHIHQRPDRDDYITKTSNDIVKCDAWNTGKMGSGIWVSNYSLMGPWDWNSITYRSKLDCYDHNFHRAQYTYSTLNSNWTLNQFMSVHDINALYRKYQQRLGNGNNVVRFADAVVSEDFDDDGLMDSVSLGLSKYDAYTYQIRLYFYRGIALDVSEGASYKQIPWFSREIGYTRNVDDRYMMTTGDLNGDNIPEVIIGDPDWYDKKGLGRVGIITVNTPARYGNDAPWGSKTIQALTWLDRRDFGLPFWSYFRLGESVATGNLSHERHDDLLIGMPLAVDPDNGLKRGGAVIHLRGTDLKDYQIVWNKGCDDARFGFSISTIPDFQEVDGTRFDSMVVGAPQDSNVGAMHVFGSSVDDMGNLQQPMVKKTLRHWQQGAEYGYAVAGFTTQEDVGEEPKYYVLTGAPGFVREGKSSGAVYLDQFDTFGQKNFVASMTESPDYSSNEDRFGSVLAVQQAIYGDRRRSSSVFIAIGAPGAFYNDNQTGKIHTWQPWKVPNQINYGTLVWAGPSNSKYGSSIAAVPYELFSTATNIFAIGAPNTTVPFQGDEFQSGALFLKSLSNNGNAGPLNQWLHVATKGDRLSSNL